MIGEEKGGNDQKKIGFQLAYKAFERSSMLGV